MFSPTHSKVLSRLSLLVPSVVLTCFCLTVRADLDVEWIDSNTIRVTGTGYGPPSVVTNWLGCCTNCTLITPDELTAGMDSISSACIDGETYAIGALGDCDILLDQIGIEKDDISSFRRFGTVPVSAGSIGERADFSNYVYTVQNTQTILDLQNKPNSALTAQVYSRWIGYNNGIYDYANTRVDPKLDEFSSQVLFVKDTIETSKGYFNTISTIADRYKNLSSCPCDDDGGGCGDGGGGTNRVGCAWTAEQIRELLDYVDHIDQDQHKRHDQLNAISNNVANIDVRMDSYAKLVSGVLYNDSTITLADGESWTNVYFNGESDGYDYDKSNILQRIELILFGMAYSSTNYAANALSITNQLDDTSYEDVTNRYSEFSTKSTNSFYRAKEKLESKVDSLRSLDTLFVFWGSAGSVGPFTLGYVPNLDGAGEGQYITVGSEFLGEEVSRFRMLCRYGFQLIWATVFLFMIWIFYVRLFKYVVIFLKYAFEWINEAFAS